MSLIFSSDTFAANPFGPCALMVKRMLLFVLTLAFGCAACAAAPYARTDQPFVDSNGRTRVVIDFLPGVERTYPDAVKRAPRTKQNDDGQKIEFFHRPQVEALVADFEQRYEFQRTGMTSWVGSSVTAFLSSDQVERLLQDPLVRQISDDTHVEFSSFPYSDSTSGGETTSWGHQAVTGKTKTVSNSRKIYVIDSGVADNDDLLSVSDRVNVACGVGGCHLSSPSTYPTVGCYAHSTHVAGIATASGGNSKGTKGVYAGVNVVSVAVLSRSGGSMCGDSATISSTAYGYALDYAYMDTLYNNSSTLVNIANISANPVAMYYHDANWYKAQELVTPNSVEVYVGCGVQPECTYEELHQDFPYAGVFIAQSAGNNDGDGTCSNNSPRHYMPAASGAADPYDGIMVVGAIDQSGATVDGYFSATTPSGLTGLPQGSNYGNCVDIWAPGDAIYAERGAFSGDTLVGTTYSNIAAISGTSMAAPHVAAAAAYYADLYSLGTPSAIEQTIRANLTTLGSDRSSTAVYMVQLN